MSVYFDKYIDEDGITDIRLSLNQEGFSQLTEDLEDLIDKYTGIKGSGFTKCDDIRLDIMELIHSIINMGVQS
jgi:hypothetical protein